MVMMPKLAFRNYLIILPIILLVIAVFAVQKGQAKDNALPFKATNVDECIQEKECVWYAFSNALGLTELDFSLTKWEKPIRVHVAGEMDKSGQLELAGTLNIISQLLPLKVQVDKTFNTLIVFSDDYERDIYQTYRKDFANVLGDKFDIVFGENFKKQYASLDGREHKCRSAYISDPQQSTHLMSFMFIPATGPYRRFCMEYEMISSLGELNKIKNFPYSILSSPQNIDSLKSSITDVDKLIIRILYSDFFDAGMSAEDVRANFDAAYLKQINQYNQNRDLNNDSTD